MAFMSSFRFHEFGTFLSVMVNRSDGYLRFGRHLRCSKLLRVSLVQLNCTIWINNNAPSYFLNPVIAT